MADRRADVVRDAHGYRIPAGGTVDYQYFEVPTNFTEDRYPAG